MTNTVFLPRLLRLLFRILTVVMAVAAVLIVVAMVANPKLPSGIKLGPMNVSVYGQPGFIVLNDTALSAQYISRDGVQARIDDIRGLLEVLKRAGLPLALMTVLYFGFLFEMMRRLFANVAQGQSFTRSTVRLVQGIGFSLLVYSVVSGLAESWFENAIFGYVVQHGHLTVSGAAINLPAVRGELHFEASSTFGSSFFLAGLLVLALSEVFRQGLALKTEADLTI